LAVLSVGFLVVGCGKHQAKEVYGVSDSAHTVAEESQRESEKYLAYIHLVSVEVQRSALKKQHESAITACANDKKNRCTILNSNLNTGDYLYGSIRLRILPQGVENIIKVATTDANIVAESTEVEDQAKAIIDSDKRIAMLTDYRDRLINMEGKAGDDIDALIKISSELSKIQSKLEKPPEIMRLFFSV